MKMSALVMLAFAWGAQAELEPIYCGQFAKSDSIFQYETDAGKPVEFALEVKRQCAYTHEDSSFIQVVVQDPKLIQVINDTFDINRPKPEMCVKAAWDGSDPCLSVIGPKQISTVGESVELIWTHEAMKARYPGVLSIQY